MKIGAYIAVGRTRKAPAGVGRVVSWGDTTVTVKMEDGSYRSLRKERTASMPLRNPAE